MTPRMFAVALVLTLVPTAALPGLKRDCQIGCATLLDAECDGLATRKAQKRCAKARLNACRRAARRAPKAERGAAIAAFCAPPTTTTTLSAPRTTTTRPAASTTTTTTTTTRPRPTTTTTTLPAVPNVRGTWFFDGSLVSDTCGLNQYFLTSGIRVTSQSGVNLAGNLGSGVIPWSGSILADGWGGVTQVRCDDGCCAQSVFAAVGFTTFADAAFELNIDCVGLGTCTIQYLGSMAKQ